MTDNFKSELIDTFRDTEYRHAYLEEFLHGYVATQIQALREQRDLTQGELADLAGMKQSQISKLEKVTNTALKVTTLQKIAKALDLALVVRFESIGSLLSDIEGFGRRSLERLSFKDDPVFHGYSVTQSGGSVEVVDGVSGTQTSTGRINVIGGANRFRAGQESRVA